jgi:N-acetylmuramoyl-L-alanine amidase
MKICDCTDCSTFAVHGLDMQLMAQVNKISAGTLADISQIPGIVFSGPQVHKWLQVGAVRSLERAVRGKGESLVINSALRTLAGQQLLRQHYEAGGRCEIMAAARPGRSNHNNASAIDIKDSEKWREALQNAGWKWIGEFDPMHYEFEEAIDTLPLQIKAFQSLWSVTHPSDKLAIDGDLGPGTLSRLVEAPVEGWQTTKDSGLPPRVLRLTQPLQQGEDVKELQLAIRAAKVRINYDGQFGPDTDRAVREYQALMGLTVDGIVGGGTRKKLSLWN